MFPLTLTKEHRLRLRECVTYEDTWNKKGGIVKGLENSAQLNSLLMLLTKHDGAASVHHFKDTLVDRNLLKFIKRNVNCQGQMFAISEEHYNNVNI